MKITKSYLREVIMEELQNIQEADLPPPPQGAGLPPVPVAAMKDPMQIITGIIDAHGPTAKQQQSHPRLGQKLTNFYSSLQQLRGFLPTKNAKDIQMALSNVNGDYEILDRDRERSLVITRALPEMMQSLNRAVRAYMNKA